MDSYQTADLGHEEQWWQLTLLAYMQLFLAKDDVTTIPKPWERYLPQYKKGEDAAKNTALPMQTQRGFKSVLEQIGTPAKKSIPRGKPRGRMLGETQPIKPISPISFKSKKSSDKTVQNDNPNILSEIGDLPKKPNPETIDGLILLIQQRLQKMGISITEFAKQLQNTS